MSPSMSSTFLEEKKTEFADKSPHDIENSDLDFLVNPGFLDLFKTVSTLQHGGVRL